MPIQDFTRAAYDGLLKALLQRGYEGRGYEDCDPASPHLILRHDIDFAPEPALSLAEIESALDLRAVYFFQLSTPFYKADDDACRSVMKGLLDLGHEIGLHFDAAAGAETADELDRDARDQCGRLEQLCGSDVRIISFHRPARALLGREEPIGGRPHTYQPRFFSEIGYSSDSRGQWRFGHPLESKAVSEGRALQLLTHPIWWANDDAGDRERALDRLIQRHGDAIKADIADVVTGYDPATGTIMNKEG